MSFKIFHVRCVHCDYNINYCGDASLSMIRSMWWPLPDVSCFQDSEGNELTMGLRSFECYSCIRSKLVSVQTELKLQVRCAQDECKSIARDVLMSMGTNYIRDYAIDIKPKKKMLFYQTHVDAFVANSSLAAVLTLQEHDPITRKWLAENTPEYLGITPMGIQDLVENGECQVVDLKTSAQTCSSCLNGASVDANMSS